MKNDSPYTRITQKVLNFPHAKLVVVVKNQSANDIQRVIDFGASTIAFGKVQESEEKLMKLKYFGDVHFIGRLQKNKVRKVIQLFSTIQSVDSLTLAEKISLEAERRKKTMKILLQVNISHDSNKTGFLPEKVKGVAKSLCQLPFLHVCGIMTIGRQNIPNKETRRDFQKMKILFQKLKPLFDSHFTEISMGMSNDYEIALEEGATLVRVGRDLF